ncbi:ATP-binding protein [Ancylobacter sp. A5.8]|uniref:ATP-binding protein n=1 Tax=Ancylobacter gelatini TaxID=2919920 RepID=UPI001F4E4569|nr:ATP-binding protein [Ancylobacter gelatini]MCJ8143595.1 ATP-binding protein [Ancylobacter gelatini]
MIDNGIDIRLVNDLSEMDRLGAALDAYADAADLPARVAFNVSLAVDEFVSNAINHGYADGRRGEIAVKVAREDGRLTLVICDDGDAFDPFTAPPPDLDASIEDRRIGGLGVHLVRRFADGSAYAREGGRNVVTLHFDLQGADTPH